MLPLQIHPDITRAETPPGAFYTSQDVFRHLATTAFAPAWHYAGPAAGVPASGHAAPFTLLPGCLNEELVWVTNLEHNTFCLSNVCTHRGALVVNNVGPLARLQCPYHGRRWGWDGQFQHQPQFREAQDFPRPCDHLAALPHHTFAGMRFVSLAPALPFEEWMADVLEYVGWMPLDTFTEDPARATDYTVRANWALYLDNYLEGLHIPFVHPALNAALDYNAYETRLLRHGNLQIGYAKPGESTFDIPAGWPLHGQPVAGLYFWLFPNLMLNFYPWGISLNVVEPQAVGQSRILFRRYVWRPELMDTGASADLHQTEIEDEAVVESVQRGLQGRIYTRGRYSPTGEACVHHFHRMLASVAYGQSGQHPAGTEADEGG